MKVSYSEMLTTALSGFNELVVVNGEKRLMLLADMRCMIYYGDTLQNLVRKFIVVNGINIDKTLGNLLNRLQENPVTLVEINRIIAERMHSHLHIIGSIEFETGN